MLRKDSYTIIISKDLNVWGSYYKETNDVARLKVPVTEADSLSISLVFTKADNGIVLNFGWDKVRVAVPFTE
jgi:hypothetical protein